VINVISLGAGVQSSTMALMAAHGELTPMPDYAVFADTGAEPKAIYQWLDWLETQLPFPVHRVSAGNLRDDLLESAKTRERVASPPLFSGTGMLWRQCTQEYKIAPIQKILGKSECVLWIGISTDEAQRMKPSQRKNIKNRWPLIEVGMSRNQCLTWMKKNNYPLPSKSSCTFCPYHDDATWRQIKLNDPESFADAVLVDKAIRGGIGKTTQTLYLHRSCKPLDEVDFRTLDDVGQLSMFGNECEGMCGV
jgi:hypothetical protein